MQSGGKVFSLVAPHGFLDLSFQTRDQNCAACSGKARDVQKFCLLIVLAGIRVYAFVKPYQTVHLEQVCTSSFVNYTLKEFVLNNWEKSPCNYFCKVRKGLFRHSRLVFRSCKNNP